MILNGMSYDVKMFEEAGQLIERTLIIMLAFNGIFVVSGIVFKLRHEIRKCYYNRRRKIAKKAKQGKTKQITIKKL